MSRPRIRGLVAPLRALAVATTFGLGVLLVVEACGSRANPAGPGGECYLATDCQPGLVCVEQANHTRVCTNDLSRVAGEVPPDGAEEQTDAAGDAAVVDGSQPDTSQPPIDSGEQDTGGPTPDTGGPPVDSGED